MRRSKKNRYEVVPAAGSPSITILFASTCTAFLLISLVFAFSACKQSSGDAEDLTPREEKAGLRYVGGEACQECHEMETRLWTGSDHDLAMDLATTESVLGDFSDATFTHYGIQTRFFKKDDQFFVHTEGPDGEMETFRVKYTFGVRPLQQYLVEFPDGRVQCLTIAWDTEKKEWFSLYPGERITTDDWLHWTKGGMNWNYMCAECHSTDLQKNFNFASNTYHTTWSEIDVNCEACHGPGEKHVELARAAEAGGPAYDPANSGLTVNLSGPEHARKQIETCAPCHSRRRIVAPDFVPGDDYLDHYGVELLEDELYYPDGQIKDEVYVYASFLQSKMYRNGVRCSDCHDPHSTRIYIQGNNLCNRCHVPSVYDTPEHHHHPDTSQAGSKCVDCHMPERTYMVVDPRRDHSFQLPRPDLTVEIGIPNVCNRCHTDETAEWAAEKIVSWYGPDRLYEPHFALAFHAGRQHEPGADQDLIDILEDTSRAGIVRATALSILGGYDTARAIEAAQRALEDPEPLVRVTAIRNIEYLPPDELYTFVSPLIRDTVRLVRTEAARVLARVAHDRFSNTPRNDRAQYFWQALEEYRQSQYAVSDQAGAHLNLAVISENLGNLDQAEEQYQTAIRLDSTFVPARINLAMLYDRRRQQAEQSGRLADARRFRAAAEQHLRYAVRFQPEMADAHYLLGLLLAENQNQLPEAAEHLATAARLNPNHARTNYNAGLAYQQIGDIQKAENFLLTAHQIEPEQPDYLNALSVFYIQQEQWQKALEYTTLLARQFPDEPALNQRIALIRQKMQAL